MITRPKFNTKLLSLSSFHLSYIRYINANIDMAGNIPYIFNHEAVIFFPELGVVVTH